MYRYELFHSSSCFGIPYFVSFSGVIANVGRTNLYARISCRTLETLNSTAYLSLL